MGNGEAALVGRDGEVAHLRRAVRRPGSVTVLEGEAGIGKTSLADAAATIAAEAGLPVLRGRAREFDERRPFGILADALHISRESASEAAREAASLLTGPAPGGGEFGDWPAWEFRIRELLVTVVDERTTDGPLAIILDDLHWADVASLNLLRQRAEASVRLPVVIVATTRPAPRTGELTALLAAWRRIGATRLRLAPLSAGECAELATRLIGHPPAARLTGRLAASGGNPLFATEMISALQAEGALTVGRDGRADVSSSGWPPSLPLVILGRLGYLGEEAVELLGIASVLGVTFDLRQLAALAELPTSRCWSRLRDAVRTGVLVANGARLAFRHELVRDALYDDLPVTVRSALHSDAARMLRAVRAPAAAVAEHVLRGAKHGGAEEVAWLHDAAREAASRSPAVAVGLLRSGLDLAPSDALVRGELLTDLALATASTGRYAEAVQLCERALRHRPRVARRAELHACLARSLLVVGRIDDARKEVDRALERGELSPVERARTLAWAAYIPLFGGDPVTAAEEARVARAEAERIGDLPAQVDAALTLAHVANFAGRHSEAEPLAARGAELADRSGTLSAYEGTPHLVHAITLVDCDRFGDASAEVVRGRELAEAFGARTAAVFAHFVAAFVGLAAGSWDDAAAELQAGRALADEVGMAWNVDATCIRALLAAYQGDRAAAAHHLVAIEAAVANGVPQYRTGWPDWVRGTVAEAAGDSRRALDDYTAAWRAATSAGRAFEYRVLGPDLARVASAAGQAGLAAEVAGELDALAEVNPAIPGLAGAACRARALAERDPDALAGALQLVRRGGRPLEAARCNAELAMLLARAGRAGEAARAAAHALDGFAELGANALAARARAAWRSAGLRPGVRGRRARPARGWAALTDTEAKVARLVAQRLTNPEIAHELVISRRTVATHVSHLLAKLDMSTRGELVAAAARGPLEQLGEHRK